MIRDAVADRPHLVLAEDDTDLAAAMRDVLEDDFSVDLGNAGVEAIARLSAGALS